VVRDAVEDMRRHGLEVVERELAMKPHHSVLADLWVRTIAVHYAAIARHWKGEGTDLLADPSLLTPQFHRMLEAGAKVSALDHALDDLLRTQVFDAIQDVLEEYDFIFSPTLAVPPVRNAADGNTIGPVEINGEAVDPLIGWCMTYPINFTGHPAISV